VSPRGKQHDNLIVRWTEKKKHMYQRRQTQLSLRLEGTGSRREMQGLEARLQPNGHYAAKFITRQ